MKRDQFGRDIRKKVDGYLSSDRIRELFEKFESDGFNSIDNFLNCIADDENIVLSKKERKHYQFPKPTKEQIEKHKAWKQKSIQKAVENNSKKPKKAIKPMNLDRLKIESDYIKAKQLFMRDHDGGCDGCGTFCGMRRFSHRIARSIREDLISDIDNLDLMCDDCHEKVELLLWDDLNNGKKIAEYVEKHEPEIYRKYLIKREKRLKS